MIKTITKLFLTLALLCSSVFAAEEFSQVRASHILVKSAAEAIQIKKDLDEGGDFEYYAQKYSICPSGQRGGDLGFFGKGQMVPEFEKKAFSLPVGEVSEPVYSPFGWHTSKLPNTSKNPTFC